MNKMAGSLYAVGVVFGFGFVAACASTSGPRLMCVSGTRLKDTLENADAMTLRALLLNPQDLATVGGAWVSSAVHRGSAASAFSGAGRVASG